VCSILLYGEVNPMERCPGDDGGFNPPIAIKKGEEKEGKEGGEGKGGKKKKKGRKKGGGGEGPNVAGNRITWKDVQPATRHWSTNAIGVDKWKKRRGKRRDEGGKMGENNEKDI